MFKKLKAKLSEQLKSKRHPKFSVMEPEVTSPDEIFLTLMAGVYDPNRLEFMTITDWSLLYSLYRLWQMRSRVDRKS